MNKKVIIRASGTAPEIYKNIKKISINYSKNQVTIEDILAVWEYRKIYIEKNIITVYVSYKKDRKL